ncbi:MAG: hypoxanthine-guanine phosphoribosyltransferase [Arenimonas sp.]
MRHDITEVLARSELLYDRAEIESAIDGMAGRIRKDLHGQFPVFLTLMHGGLFFAARLGLALNIDAEFDYLHATRYHGETTGSGGCRVDQRAAGIDDIVDEGHTLKAVRDWCEDQGAARVRIAAMAVKLHDRCVPGLESDYSGFTVPDRYVFGYGMDINEHGRNLPGIYALK